jgi:hypothetical protein
MGNPLHVMLASLSPDFQKKVVVSITLTALEEEKKL